MNALQRKPIAKPPADPPAENSPTTEMTREAKARKVILGNVAEKEGRRTGYYLQHRTGNNIRLLSVVLG